MNWPKVDININGELHKAIAPTVISASRATDIPAFYAKEFVECLKKGYLYWQNPFNGKKSLVAFEKTTLIVFWSKNPRPVFPYLEEIKNLGFDYYFTFTLNDYEHEGYESALPSQEKRLATFIELADRIGKKNVVWRFDPVILTSIEDIERLSNRISSLAQKLCAYTEKLVFSFVDTKYQKVKTKLKNAGIKPLEWTDEIKYQFARVLSEKMSNYDLQVATCAEELDLTAYGIINNKCIDDDLIIRSFPQNRPLQQFIQELKLKNKLKDKGQREFCKCIPSKDIGKYNSCGFNCVYCYAIKRGESSIQTNIFE